jgi:tetratricopeptide (TPR) repeat protein
MSLLIKALDKAQNAKTEQAEKSKQQQADESKAVLELEADVSNKLHTETLQSPAKAASPELELSLSPTNSSFSEAPVDVVKTASTGATSASAASTTTTSNQQPTSQPMSAISAANVFSAKGVEAKTDSTRLAMIAGAGLIALLGMGLYFYQFVDNSSPIVLPPRPLEQTVTGSQIIPDAQNADTLASASELVTGYSEAEPSATEPAMPPAFVPTESKQKMPIKKESSASAFEKDETMRTLGNVAGNDSEAAESKMAADESVLAENADDSTDRLQASFSANKANKKSRKSTSNAAIASESASFSVTKSTPQPSVNPVLMSAYEAYNAGKDAEAQQLYKQVLRRDIRNVDALLGLGAIASRQGRSADANAWYGKVLEVDPRNSIAQAALLDNRSQGSELNNETRLKNMLAKQPDDANLHVALGNLYAEQNQWPAAQQAYFDAYSLNRSVDNAYNLAVSLDQMGKSKLALPYYQQALAQASDTSNIDRAALSARIAAIQ